MRFYDDWLTKDLDDDSESEQMDGDHSDEQFDKWDRERDLT